MDPIFSLDPLLFAMAVAVTFVAAFVKGAVGFAMPMIMISGLGSFLPAETALAALILPTVLTNVWQAGRDGLKAIWDGIVKYRVYVGVMLVMIMLTAQLVSVIPSWLMFLLLGLPISLFALSQLLGWRAYVPPHRRTLAEVLIGGVAGAMGGVSGVWGPPTTLYLTAIDTPKREQLRVQGMIFGTGAVVLFAAHLKSGVLNAQTLPLSAAMVVPALIGLALGFLVHDRMDQARFRKATLFVLVIAGLNLVRRALIG